MQSLAIIHCQIRFLRLWFLCRLPPLTERLSSSAGFRGPTATSSSPAGGVPPSQCPTATARSSRPSVLRPNRLNTLFVTATNVLEPSTPAPIRILQDSQPPNLFIDFP